MKKLTQAELFKEEGISRVLANEKPDWIAELRAFVERDVEGEFTIADVRPHITEPHHRNCWGAAFNTLAKGGLIRCIGYRRSTIKSSHARKVSVWKRT